MTREPAWVRTKALQRRVDGLERHRNQLERILARALQAAAGQDCDPLALLAVLEELDGRLQTPHSDASVDELVQLLRDTDPDTIKGRAAT